MSANSNNQNDMNNSEGQVVAVDQPSDLQVETLGTNHATGELTPARVNSQRPAVTIRT